MTFYPSHLHANAETLNLNEIFSNSLAKKRHLVTLLVSDLSKFVERGSGPLGEETVRTWGTGQQSAEYSNFFRARSDKERTHHPLRLPKIFFEKKKHFIHLTSSVET